MTMRIYGLDIGTTSIGWAVVEYDVTQAIGRILAMGARSSPKPAFRTELRSTRLDDKSVLPAANSDAVGKGGEI
ncbi:putative cytosolic protein [Granulibacter bethesdensis]|uniref:Cytosolic protein n=1 Tax=Granulibacter bethesdensis TaxID=364410 RepID=A0AAN0RE68_9PROT|nr:putative cytosolic protein [Granulibacter bethesdensis]